jgi:hypothetical protein
MSGIFLPRALVLGEHLSVEICVFVSISGTGGGLAIQAAVRGVHTTIRATDRPTAVRRCCCEYANMIEHDRRFFGVCSRCSFVVCELPPEETVGIMVVP